MMRVFNELTPECEITARMYAQGYEKKDIADLKCRAVSTINNQLQKAFEILHVRNGRELATMLYERITGVKFWGVALITLINLGITPRFHLPKMEK